MISINIAFYLVPFLTFLTLLFIVSFSYETRINRHGFKVLILSFILYLSSTLIYAIFINMDLDRFQSIPFIIMMASNYTFYVATCRLLEVGITKRLLLKLNLYIIVPSLFHIFVVTTDAYLFLRGFTSTLVSAAIFINVLIEIARARKRGLIIQRFSQLDLFLIIYIAVLLVALITVLSSNVNYIQAWSPFEVICYILSSVVRIALGFGYTLLVQKMLFQQTTKSDYVKLTEYDFVKQISETDHLTSIYNRQKIDEILTEYANAKGLEFSVLFIDVNDFKSINDTYGHLVGDDVLKAIARTLKNSLRSSDFVGRWGGDEFLVILAESTQKNVELVISKLKNNVNKLKVDDLENVSVSVGSFISTQNESVQEILSTVDKMLYTEKNSKTDN